MSPLGLEIKSRGEFHRDLALPLCGLLSRGMVLAQEGLNAEYVARVRQYLSKLDKLAPSNEREAKMQGFFRDTLARARKV